MLEGTQVGHALRRLLAAPESWAQARMMLGVGDERVMELAQTANVAPDVYDFHNSRAIYEDVMDNREAIAEHGQRVLGVPYAETMAELDEWAAVTWSSLESMRPSLPVAARAAKQYARAGKGSIGKPSRAGSRRSDRSARRGGAPR